MTENTGEAGLGQVPASGGAAMFWGRDGQPLSLLAYANLHKDPEYRFLGRDRVGDREVITAWLGIDQGDDDSAPLIFGTIVYNHATGTYGDDREEFTATEPEALAMHAKHLERIRTEA